MLITTEVEMKLTSRNIKSYENKGYNIPRKEDRWGKIRVPKGTTITIKVNDLPDGSSTVVSIKCDCEDCKSPYLKPTKWQNYKKYVKNDGKYYCTHCNKRLYGGENLRKALLKNSGSIAETHPQLVKYFVNKEDTEIYSHGSRKRVDMICSDCGYIKRNMQINELHRRGFSCPRCSDSFLF